MTELGGEIGMNEKDVHEGITSRKVTSWLLSEDEFRTPKTHPECKRGQYPRRLQTAIITLTLFPDSLYRGSPGKNVLTTLNSVISADNNKVIIGQISMIAESGKLHRLRRGAITIGIVQQGTGTLIVNDEIIFIAGSRSKLKVVRI